MIKSPLEDLDQRQPVWNALSDLFRDTKLDDSDYDYLAAELCKSPYSTTELERILFDEVYPVLIPNLWSVAGEWTGFDPAWLQTAILARHCRKWKWPAKWIPGRGPVAEDWNRVKRRLTDRGR